MKSIKELTDIDIKMIKEYKKAKAQFPQEKLEEAIAIEQEIGDDVWNVLDSAKGKGPYPEKMAKKYFLTIKDASTYLGDYILATHKYTQYFRDRGIALRDYDLNELENTNNC